MGDYYNDPLFAAILAGDVEEIKRLKAQGAKLSANVKFILSKYGYICADHTEIEKEIDRDFQIALRSMDAEVFVKAIRTLRDEVGEAIYMPSIWQNVKRIMLEDGVWECVLDCLYHKLNLKPTPAMKKIIDADRADLLEMCAKCDWLAKPKKRDEMIKYASDNHKTECTAWLLDFKNKNFDLAAERAKAEKKAERELNAVPNSVTAMKQIWNFQTYYGDPLVITGYKGSQTEVVVPEKIGYHIVTEIRGSAFCPFARRITPEVKQVRKAITKITLPETVRVIGRGAFWACGELVSVNIPDGVKVINENTFAECRKLEKIAIPNSVKCIERRAFFKCESLRFIEVPEDVELINEGAFAMCSELTTLVLPGSLKYISNLDVVTNSDKFVGAVVPRGSYAEEYCKKNDIPYTYKEDKTR